MFSWLTIPVNGIVLGQVLSLLVTSTSSISTELALHGASIPFTQGAINYALLFLVFAGPVRLMRWRWQQPAWKYMLVSGIDVLSTGCIVKAFSRTSITSVTLLDSWTIPCVIFLTSVVFGQKYSLRQAASAALAVSGLAVLLLFDDSSDDGTFDRTSALMGDALVLAGATGYAVNNVVSEHILKTGDAAELLGGLGCFGILASAVLVPLVESHALSQITWSWNMFLLLAAYGVALFLFSLGMPILLHKSGSTVFNLSLLTSDIYAFTARGILFQGFSRQALGVYVVSCSMVVCGLLLYFTSPEVPSESASECTRAQRYSAVNLYDAYTSSDVGQRDATEWESGGRRSAASGEDDGAVRIEHEADRGWGSGSEARGSEMGGSPGQCAIIRSPVLSCTAHMTGPFHKHDLAAPDGMELRDAKGNAGHEREGGGGGASRAVSPGQTSSSDAA